MQLQWCVWWLPAAAGMAVGCVSSCCEPRVVCVVGALDEVRVVSYAALLQRCICRCVWLLPAAAGMALCGGSCWLRVACDLGCRLVLCLTGMGSRFRSLSSAAAPAVPDVCGLLHHASERLPWRLALCVTFIALVGDCGSVAVMHCT